MTKLLKGAGYFTGAIVIVVAGVIAGASIGVFLCYCTIGRVF